FPMTMLSFALDALVYRDDWSGWKATNVALHLLTGLVLYLLFVAIGTQVLRDAARGRELALVATALWLIHPLQVSTVLYTVQRMTVLATLFTVLGLWLYARGRVAHQHGRRGAVAILAGLLVCTPLAALSKESGALLPFLAGALELTVFAGAARPRWLAPVLLALTVLPALVGLWLFLREDAAFLLRGYALRDFGPLERLLTEPRVILLYLRWILLPRWQDYGFYHDDIRVSESLSGDPAATAALALVAALLGVTIALRRRTPLLACGLAVFLVGLALESSFIGLDLAFEHRTYLPLAGFGLIAARGLAMLGRGRVRHLVAATAGAVLLLLTATRVLVWGDPGQFHAHALAAHPASTRARVVLAEWRLAAGDAAGAMVLVEGRSEPAFAAARERISCAASGRPTLQLTALVGDVERARTLDSYANQALLFLAEATLAGRCAIPAPTVRAMLAAMAGHAAMPATRYAVGVYAARFAWAAGEPGAALAWLRRAERHQRGDAFVHLLAAEWQVELGELGAAREALDRARARDDGGRYAALVAAVAALIDEAETAR
ncbi:MAG: hypothetical protein RLW42_26260, partial [Gammaproteobacteria bacterium]